MQLRIDGVRLDDLARPESVDLGHELGVRRRIVPIGRWDGREYPRCCCDQLSSTSI